MILTDYFRPSHDLTWDYAIASGVSHGVIRLPEDGKFDYEYPEKSIGRVKMFNGNFTVCINKSKANKS